MEKNQKLIKKIVMLAILSGLSIVFYVVGPKFPLPIFPSFLEINFSYLPIFIGFLIFGYKEALIILGLRLIIKLPFTSTFCVGELADFILGFITISVTSLFNLINFKKNKVFIIISLSLVGWIIGGIISNSFSLPLYMRIFGGKEVIIQAMSMIPNVTKENYFIKYIFYCAIPFNLIIGSCVSIISFLVHNRIKSIYERKI